MDIQAAKNTKDIAVFAMRNESGFVIKTKMGSDENLQRLPTACALSAWQPIMKPNFRF